MHTEQAVKLIRKNGIKVVGGKNEWYIDNYEKPYTDRGMIKYATMYSSEGQRNPVKANTKEERRRKNRAATKEALHREDYDKFGTGKLAKDGNIWNWD